MSIPVTLKWSKQTFSLAIELGESALSFKQRVESLTGVPVTRQKLFAKKGGWKGILKDDVILDSSVVKNSATCLNVTLIGSAETLAEPAEKTTFIEDLSPDELRAAENAQAQAAMSTAHGMIQALQLPPHRRDDHKQETYQYNRLVTGLPQRQIEQELKHGQGDSQELQGKVAMSLGLELRRAYVNDLAVLDDGTCVSAMDDGHIQLWRHASQQEDVVHPGGEGGVDSVVTLSQENSPFAFASAGRGSLQLWTRDAEPILTLPGAIPGTSPASLECVFGNSDTMDSNTTTCLAARFQITRPSNPLQFRLPPQNDAERQRRAQAVAQEEAIQRSLQQAARSLQVWFSVQDVANSSTTASMPSLRTQILEPSYGLEGSAPITCLSTMSLPSQIGSSRILIAGDVLGGLRIWIVQHTGTTLKFMHNGVYQLTHFTEPCSIVCMEALKGGCLAVSTDTSNVRGLELAEATPINVHASRAVHILDLSQLLKNRASMPTVKATLTGHSSDCVICMCQLPNGDLLTGGGKLDATLQLWSQSQLEFVSGGEGDTREAEVVPQSKAHKTLTEVGYVFSLVLLPDAKDDSHFYAVAAARYNTIKIVI